MLRLATKFPPTSTDAFELAAQAGYGCAEFWLSSQLLESPSQITALAEPFSLEYALHFPNRGELSDKLLRKSIELFHGLNCQAMVIHQPMFDRYGKRLMELDADIRLGVENHNLADEDRLTAWAESNPWLTLDVEHLWMYTVQDGSLKKLMRCLRRFLDRYAEKLIHVHLPGYRPGAKLHRPQYCSREMVMRVLTALREYEFDGMVVSETAEKFQNLEELTMDCLLFQRWCIEQGVESRASSTTFAT